MLVDVLRPQAVHGVGAEPGTGDAPRKGEVASSFDQPISTVLCIL